MELLTIAVAFAVVVGGIMLKNMKYSISQWSDDQQVYVEVKPDMQSWLKYMKEETQYLWKYTEDLVKFAVLQTWWTWILVSMWRVHVKQPVESLESFRDMLVQVMIMKGAVAMLQVMKKLQAMCEQVKKILEKTSYIERRLEMGGRIADKARTLDQDLETYDAIKGGKVWLERRLRDQFAEFFQSRAGITEGIMTLWSLICTEVVLRKCRDYMQERVLCVESAAQDGDKKQMRVQQMAMKEQVKLLQKKTSLSSEESEGS